MINIDIDYEHYKNKYQSLPLNVVHNLVLEEDLPIVGGDVEGHLVLNDDLTDVLDSSSTWGRRSDIDQLVDLEETRIYR